MTLEQKMIDELKRLDAAATSGPWERFEDEFSSPHGRIATCGLWKYNKANEDDAALIVAMRNALLALLEEVEKGPKWIPVTQELPPIGKWVLAWRTFNGSESSCEIAQCFKEGASRRWVGDVTHWMLLPPAPASDDAREG